MAFVYHGVPRDMVGDVIYPLNRLRQVDERLYEVQAGKYAGRETVLDFCIPGLGVKFNDAVHCAALHPHHLSQACVAAGFEVPRRPGPPAAMTGLAFEVPIERIIQHPSPHPARVGRWANRRQRTENRRLGRAARGATRETLNRVRDSER
jgi:hypothetical protein